MSAERKPRRVCMLPAAAAGHSRIPTVANRSLFHYWAILAPHFRNVLVPSQNMPDKSVQWAWVESEAGEAISATELATLRKRLGLAQQSLSDASEDEPEGTPKAATIKETTLRMNGIVAALVALPDERLTGYAVRTDRGVLLHSWGLSDPLPLHAPDSDLEIAGLVRVDGKCSGGQTVILDKADGSRVAQTTTDADGRFVFPQIVTGSYRVRVLSRPPAVVFAAKGHAVEIFAASVTTLEIDNENESGRPGALPKGITTHRRARFIGAGLVALGIVIAVLLWRAGTSGDSQLDQGTAAWEANVAPKAVASEEIPKERSETRAPSTALDPKAGGTLRPSSLHAHVAPSTKRDDDSERTTAKRSVAADSQEGPTSASNETPGASEGVAPSAGAGAAGGGAGGSTAGVPLTQSGAGGVPAGANQGSGGAAALPSATQAASVAPPLEFAAVVAPPPAPGSRKSNGTSQTDEPPPDENDASGSPRSERQRDTKTASRSDSFPTTDAITSATPETANEVRTDTPEPTVSRSGADAPDSKEDEEQADEIEDKLVKDSDATPTLVLADDRSAPGGGTTSPVAAAWTTGMTVHWTPWRPHLIRDTIVPTMPTREGQDDALRALSTQVLAAKQAMMPSTLDAEHMLVGIRVSFTVEVKGPLRWDLSRGDAPALATVDEDSAEIAWRGGTPRGEFLLIAEKGEVVARVTGDPARGVSVSSYGAVQSWPWVAIECAPEEATSFRWQALERAAVPATWLESTYGVNGHGRRWDLNASENRPGTGGLTLAIVHVKTGWALSSRLEQQHTPK